MKKFLMIPCIMAAMMTAACSGNVASRSGSSVNPRDTVVVPEDLSGEDSITYIENTILKSPISAEDLLGLAEVHNVEEWLFNYNNPEKSKENPEHAKEYLATHRDSAALRLANKFLRMADLVNMNGDANDKLQWAVAVNTALEDFRKEVPSVPSDSVLDEISRVIDKFSSQTQTEINFNSSVYAAMDYYRTIEAYRRWLMAVPDNLRKLAQEEYTAWHDLNEARFAFWNDVSSNQEWYSMKPMEIQSYYENLSENRRAELETEKDIILNGKPYRQKGKTVTASQWEAWIAESSVPEDIDLLREMKREDRIPGDSLVADRVANLKSTFSRWLKARQALAAALPKEQGDSYDNLTADIHCRLIGKLDNIHQIEDW